MLHDPLPDIVKQVEITINGGEWSGGITLLYEAFIDTIGRLLGSRRSSRPRRSHMAAT